MTDPIETTEQKQTTNIVDMSIIKFLQSLDKGNFGTKDKILFFKELSYLLNGGISLVESMRIISTSSDNYALKEIGKDISKFLHAGKPLSYALNRLPDYFDEGDYNVIKAGEASGNLASILKSLSEEYVFMSDIKNKYIGALLYPLILVVIAIVAVVTLFWFVLPNMFEIAADFNPAELPRITRTLKDISDFLLVQWKLILGVIAGI
jgi:type II secretory pathway component PulF